MATPGSAERQTDWSAMMRAMVPVFLAALALAGCAGAPSTGTGNVATFYSPSLVTEVARDGAMPLVVHGRPTPGLNPATAARQIAERIALPGWLPKTRLRPSDGAERYRLVLIFNPTSIAAAANHPCGPLDGIGTAPSGQEIRVVGAFCAGDRAATMNTGRIDAGPDTVERGALDGLVRQLVYSLFPADNRTLRNSDDRTYGRWNFGN